MVVHKDSKRYAHIYDNTTLDTDKVAKYNTVCLTVTPRTGLLHMNFHNICTTCDRTFSAFRGPDKFTDAMEMVHW